MTDQPEKPDDDDDTTSDQWDDEDTIPDPWAARSANNQAWLAQYYQTRQRDRWLQPLQVGLIFTVLLCALILMLA
jgi:hypothetical protein